MLVITIKNLSGLTALMEMESQRTLCSSGPAVQAVRLSKTTVFTSKLVLLQPG